MATIQIRDIPDEAYAEIVRKAKSHGQSIQQYMRNHVIDFAFTPDRAQLHQEIRANLAQYGSLASREQILEAIDEDRQ